MKISVIGAGAMGGAVITGLLKSGFSASDLVVADPSEKALAAVAAKGVATTIDNNAAVKDADLVMVFVKPWLVGDVLTGIKPDLDSDRLTLAVIAAGISSEQIIGWLDTGFDMPQTALVIPNTAAATMQSMTFVSPVNAMGDALKLITDTFDRVGTTLVVEERLLASGTTLASCGIAYALRYIRAAVEGGVELGFRADVAQEIVAQTVKGAASLLENGAHAESEIDKVTTPGGLTIKGLNEMERAGFSAAVVRGLKAGLK